jgi:hypothetical protein
MRLKITEIIERKKELMLKQIKLRNIKGCHQKKISKRSVLGI